MKTPNADELVIKTNERVRWTEELHEIFVAAALKLGPKAVPSKVLAEMKCTVLTRDQVASHLQNYRPILFGKEEAPAKNTQPAVTKKLERKKRGTPEAPKDAQKKKKQRVTLPDAKQIEQASKIYLTESKPPSFSVPKIVAPASVKASAPVKVPPPVETPVTPVKIDPFLSMPPDEASESLIDQFFGDFELIGVDFSNESPVNDGSGNNGNSPAQSFTETEKSLFVDGRLGNFEIVEDGDYPSPQSDCSFVCSSPPVVQASPAESPARDPFELDWNSPEFQLGEFEIEGVTSSSQEIKSNYDETTNNCERDHSCWYCDSYTTITSFI